MDITAPNIAPHSGERPHKSFAERLRDAHWNYHLLLLSVLVGVAMFVLPAPAALPLAGWRTLALFIPIVIVWATEAIPVGVATLLFLSLVVAFHLVGPEVAFRGYVNNLPWLVVGGFAIGLAMEQTGLSKRMAYFLMSHLRGFWGVAIGAYIANLCMIGVGSVAARAAIMAPPLRGILESIGNPKESNLSRVLTFAFITSSHGFLSNLVLTGGVANLLMLAFYGSLGGGHTISTINWVQWLELLAIPTVTLYACAMIGAWLLYRPEPELVAKLHDTKTVREDYAALGPMSAAEWRVLGLFALAIVLWVLGGQIKLDPGFAALIVMGLLFLPVVGVLHPDALGRINWNIALLVGGAIGIGGILDQTGVMKALSGALVGPILNPLAHFGLFGIAIGCIVVGLIAHFLLPSPANTTLAFPLVISWGFGSQHLPAAQVLAFLGMLSVFGNNVVMLPYQFPTYYVFLGMDITNNSRFNELLIKVYPFQAMGMLIATYMVYALILATGFGIG